MNSWWAAERQRQEESKMKALRYGAFLMALAMAGLVHVQSAKSQETGHVSDRERLIGAWHLEHIDSPGPEGKSSDIPQPQGMLIYTQDGHMSVQLMYPESANNQSNQYVLDGYEASFGSYAVDEATHTLTHHVQGSNTRSLLVGKDLRRVYRFTADGKLVIRSAQPDEHWSATWEHY
jgi:hypothetical protein